MIRSTGSTPWRRSPPSENIRPTLHLWNPPRIRTTIPLHETPHTHRHPSCPCQSFTGSRRPPTLEKWSSHSSPLSQKLQLKRLEDPTRPRVCRPPRRRSCASKESERSRRPMHERVHDPMLRLQETHPNTMAPSGQKNWRAQQIHRSRRRLRATLCVSRQDQITVIGIQPMREISPPKKRIYFT